jgi:hypothetical protein
MRILSALAVTTALLGAAPAFAKKVAPTPCPAVTSPLGTYTLFVYGAPGTSAAVAEGQIVINGTVNSGTTKKPKLSLGGYTTPNPICYETTGDANPGFAWSAARATTSFKVDTSEVGCPSDTSKLNFAFPKNYTAPATVASCNVGTTQVLSGGVENTVWALYQAP